MHQKLTGIMFALFLAFPQAGSASAASPAIIAAEGQPPPAAADGMLAPRSAPRPVPDLAFVDVDAHPRRLSEFRGRVVLLNLWATWCPPCRRELPTLDHLQAILGGPGFEVVALSIDRGGLAAVTSYFDQFDVRALRVYVDASAHALSEVGSIGLPTTLLIGRDGREIARHVGPADWDRPDIVALLRHYIAANDASVTPASFMRRRAAASDPDVSIARQASSTTVTSNP